MSVFNSASMNVITNCFSNETVNCGDIDAPRMKSLIKQFFRAKNYFYKEFLHKNNNILTSLCFKKVSNQPIQTVKQSYFNKIFQDLDDPNISNNPCWTLLNSLLNAYKTPSKKYIVDFQVEIFVFFLEYFLKYSEFFLFVKIIYGNLFLFTSDFFIKVQKVKIGQVQNKTM